MHPRGAAAGITAAMLLGMRDALDQGEDGSAAVADHGGEGDGGERVTVFLHPDVPEATLVLIRPGR